MRLSELSPTASVALLRITTEGECFQSDIYHELNTSSYTGSALARTLASQGLIAREETTHNARRTYRLVPTHPSLPNTLPEVTPAEARALLFIYRSPDGLAQSALTQQLDVTRKRTSTLARRLATKNLIQREPTTIDGARTFRLTPVALDDLVEDSTPQAPDTTADGPPEPDTPNQESITSPHPGPRDAGPNETTKTTITDDRGVSTDREPGGDARSISASSPTAGNTVDPGLTPTEARAMDLIRGRGELLQRDLARGLDIDDAATEQLVRSLVDAGLIETKETTFYGRSATFVSAPSA